MTPSISPALSLCVRRARLAACAAALLLCGSLAMAADGPGGGAPAGAQDLRTLEALVRGGAGDALARLRQAGAGYAGEAPYADQVGYLQLLAQASRDAGQPDAADAADERLVALALTHGDSVHAALGALGRVRHLASANPTAALATLGALDARYARLRDPQFVATVQQLYGELYLALGQFDFALGHYLKALEIARGHPLLLDPTVSGLRVAIARVYTYTRAPEKVLAALPDAGPEGAGLPPLARARVFMYKGIAEILLGNWEAARAALRASLAVARAHGLLVVQADVLDNISDSYLEQHRYPEAALAAREAIGVAARAGDGQTARIANVNLGFALVGEGQLAEGLRLIDGVVRQMREAGTLPDLADVLEEESRALEGAGRYQAALAVLRDRQDITARLSSSEREKTVAVLQEQFNAQQRAIQFEGLRRENALKDREIQQRRVWQLIAWSGAGLALLLCGFVFRLYRRSQRTQHRLEELNAELAFHSTHDALTGLLNRRSFREQMLARDRQRAGRPDSAPAECFVLLDIDHFKAINDRHGHGAGDEVLVEVARRLREAVGTRGLAMRWGGEEFLVHLESADTGGHVPLVRELLDAVAGSPVAAEGCEALSVTITAGALSLPAQADAQAGARPGWQGAVALADQALYKGKQGGRNRAWLIDGAAAGAPRFELILPGLCPPPGGRTCAA